MSKRKLTKITMMLLLMIFSNILIFKYANLDNSYIKLSFNVISEKVDLFQVFYSENTEWTEENSQKVNYDDIGKNQKLEVNLPINTLNIRIDLGNQPANLIMSNIKLSYYGKETNVKYDKLVEGKNLVQINNIKYETNKLYISTSGTDPYFIYSICNAEINDFLNYRSTINYAIKFSISLIIDILIYIILKKSKSVLVLVQDLYNSRRLIWNLAKNDFKTKYAGSYLGIIWAFIQPVITLLVYWIVFEFGLKAGSPTKGIPFMLWFSVGLIPWFLFSDAVNNSMNCLFEYSYLVKKVVFKISVLPIIKIISSLFIHFVFISFIIILSYIYGFYPTWYIIQLIYYVFCAFFLILALSYATSAIVLFFKDLGQIINILLQVGMWATPIMWSYTIVPEKYQWIIKLNPMYYIVEGYRDTFINHIWFFDKYFQTIYFWIIALGIFSLSALIFKKLKPHFADVL